MSFRVCVAGLATAIGVLCAMAGPTLANPPVVLVLSGEKVAELTFSGEGGGTIVEDASLRTVEVTKIKEAATFVAAAGKEADSERGEALLTFEGWKQGAIACRSENAKGEKDPVETVLLRVKLLVGNEESSSKTLESIVAYVLEAPFVLNCGGVKTETKGAWPCLATPTLSELAAGGSVEVRCAQKEGVQSTGKCVESKETCETLASNPLLSNLGGKFEVAGVGATVKGTFNRMVTVSD
jgi:hypothetical protein